MNSVDRIGAVVIGRNEGERLTRCLASLGSRIPRVYVDSCSSDRSVENARAMGVEVIELTVPPKLSAARARNTGLQHIVATHPSLDFVMMVDGDCDVEAGWIETATHALDADAKLAGVYGRRRERFPGNSIYNALCDDEWNTPIGDSATFGGDVMLRVSAAQAAGGYDPAMIAGEDPDFALRIGRGGWTIRRIDAPMTIHDAAILQFGQWWKRTRRAGHAFAELAGRHPDYPAWSKSCRSIVIWGAVLPVLLLVAILVALVAPMLWPLPLLIALIWPAKIAQIALRQRPRFGSLRIAAASGAFLMLGKMAELSGLIDYHRGKRGGREAQLIEYKGAAR